MKTFDATVSLSVQKDTMACKGQLRRENSQKLLAGPTKQQSIFTRIRDFSAAAVKPSHLIANDIALALNNVMRGEFLKRCKLKAVEIACPEKR